MPDYRTPRATAVWLVRQMSNASGSVLVDVYQKSGRIPVTASLRKQREDPKAGLPESKQPPKKFPIRLQTGMGTGRRSTHKKGLIDSVIDSVIEFYANVFQGLQAFVPRAPALERRHRTDGQENTAEGHRRTSDLSGSRGSASTPSTAAR